MRLALGVMADHALTRAAMGQADLKFEIADLKFEI
jgi:hypothetical protein